MRLRALRPDDRAPLAALLSRVETFTDDERAVALELVDEKIKDASSSYAFIVGVDDADDRVIEGYLCWGRTPMTARTVDLYWIVTDAAKKGRGIGKRLLQALEDTMRAEGLLTVRVETASKEAYDGTIAFYEKTAFVLSGRIPDFYADGDDLLIFTKRVSA